MAVIVLAGVVLVGTCPGGTASNVITYLSKGDVALSVGMTSVNTLLTPAITYLFLHRSIEVDVKSMFLSIVQVVIIPIALGLIINRFLGKYTEKVTQFMPMLSVTAICLIVMSFVSHNSEKILTSGITILAVVILHNLSGYAVGFGIGKLLRLDMPKTKALSIEIGMQNSGLASSLAPEFPASVQTKGRQCFLPFADRIIAKRKKSCAVQSCLYDLILHFYSPFIIY